MEKRMIQRMFFTRNFKTFSFMLAPAIGLRMVDAGSYEEQVNLERELVELYRWKLADLLDEDPEGIRCWIKGKLYQEIEPVVRRVIGEGVEVESWVEGAGEIYRDWWCTERFASHIAGVVSEHGGISLGLSDMIEYDLMLSEEKRAELLRELRKAIKWYEKLYHAAEEEVLRDLEALIERKTGKNHLR